MAYRWESAGASDGAREAGLGRAFDTQEQAEAWLTAFYEDLVDTGVEMVSLVEEGRLVYGPMSLLA